MNATTDILAQILARKREEISQRRQLTSINSLEATARAMSPPRGFATALRQQVVSGQAAVIAEIKKASPSQGVIRRDFVPREIARSYSDHGATCLSVLTDETFFQGRAEHLDRDGVLPQNRVVELPVGHLPGTDQLALKSSNLQGSKHIGRLVEGRIATLNRASHLGGGISPLMANPLDKKVHGLPRLHRPQVCLLYTSDAADE